MVTQARAARETRQATRIAFDFCHLSNVGKHSTVAIDDWSRQGISIGVGSIIIQNEPMRTGGRAIPVCHAAISDLAVEGLGLGFVVVWQYHIGIRESRRGRLRS